MAKRSENIQLVRKRFERFSRALHVLENITCLTLCIHDITGFSSYRKNRLLDSAFRFHRHPFCLSVKSEKQVLCTRDDVCDATEKEGRERKPFIKTCHANIWEVVVPIISGVQHMGTVFAGPVILRKEKERVKHDLPVMTRKQLLDIGLIIQMMLTNITGIAELMAVQEVIDAGYAPRVKRAIEYINSHLNQSVTVRDAAAAVHLSPSRFAHVFAEQTGVSFHRFLINARIQRAKNLLEYSSLSINRITVLTGFCNQNYFANVFKKITGLAPTQYRKKKQTSVYI